MMSNPDTALETLAREELGIDPDELGGSAWEAAITSFLLFSLGAIVPVHPVPLRERHGRRSCSASPSAPSRCSPSARAITLFTGRSVLFSGTRQVAFGLVAAALTFGIGRAVGVSLSQRLFSVVSTSSGLNPNGPAALLKAIRPFVSTT